MNNFYLSEKYLGNIEYFKKNIYNLIEIYNIRNEEEDEFYKDNLYVHPNYLTILNEYSQENQEILTFIERIKTNKNKISTIQELNEKFSSVEDDNAFLGLDFTMIEKMIYHIKMPLEYNEYKTNNAKIRLFSQKEEIVILKLTFLYDEYTFKPQAIQDIQQITKEHREKDFSKLFELLDDIKFHPHTGGLGKTEALKGQSGKCSKRLDGGERIIYSLKEGKITIYSFLGHYEGL